MSISTRDIVLRLLNSLHEADYFLDGLSNALEGAEIPAITQSINDLIFLLVFGQEDLEDAFAEKWYRHWSKQRSMKKFSPLASYDFLERLRDRRAKCMLNTEQPRIIPFEGN